LSVGLDTGSAIVGTGGSVVKEISAAFFVELDPAVDLRSLRSLRLFTFGAKPFLFLSRYKSC
jgi:hypothetical protein